MRGLIACVAAGLLFGASASALLSQNVFDGRRADEQFSGRSCQPGRLGVDPAVCQDDQRIHARELASRTTARAFPYVASGTRMGQLGRYLETHGFVDGTGVCQGRPGYLILFLRDGMICDANRVEESFNGQSDGTGNNGGGGGGGGVPGGNPRGGTIPSGIQRQDNPCERNYDMNSAAGRAQWQANKARDAAACCRARKRYNPGIVCEPEAPRAQTPGPLRIRPQQQPKPVADCWKPPRAHWNRDQINQIVLARRDALNELARARQAVVAWSDATKAQAREWFGTDTARTRETLIGDIDGAQRLLQRADAGNFYQGFAQRTKSGKLAAAYVLDHGPTSGDLEVFVTNEFWPIAAWAKTHVLIHEASHHRWAGATDDNAYHPDNCRTLAILESWDAGAARWLGRPEPVSRALDNADNFAYFVQSFAPSSAP